MNHDLTDDAAFDLPVCEDWKDGTIVKIARSFDEPEEHIKRLPYRIGYSIDKGLDGKVRENMFISDQDQLVELEKEKPKMISDG